MKFSKLVTMVTFILALPGLALAQTLTLAPASPQPSGLKGGLSVNYAYPGDVKSLSDARRALDRRSKAGPALKGLSYQDTREGAATLTSKFSTKVAADISGYMRFDSPGTYTLNIYSNDGVEAFLGGQEIAFFDGRHPCEAAGEVNVSVPRAGWYKLEMLYFQRQGTACLMMERAPQGGAMAQVPNGAFAH